MKTGVIISFAYGVLSIQGFLTASCSEVFTVYSNGQDSLAGGILTWVI